MQGLKEKPILLTGAAGGIGRAIAKRLHMAECRLILAEKTDALAAQARQYLPDEAEIISLAGDISQPETAAHIVQQAEAAFGGLYGLVNNAAILEAKDGGIVETDYQTWQTTLNMNLTSVYLMCHHALPALKHYANAHGGSAIINMSSITAHRGSAQAQIAYTTAKGGVEALTREIAIAHARDNIRANCVAAGPVKTERTAHYFDTDEKWQLRRRHIPMGRLGKPEEIAGLVAFLLSEEANYMTGASYLADGGIAHAYLVDDKNN